MMAYNAQTDLTLFVIARSALRSVAISTKLYSEERDCCHAPLFFILIHQS